MVGNGGDSGVPRLLDLTDKRIALFQLENMTRSILGLRPFTGSSNDVNMIPPDRNNEVIGRPAELNLNIYIGNPRTLTIDRVEPRGR